MADSNQIKITMNPQSKIRTDLGFGRMGRVQRFVDSEIARGMDDLVPFREGYLKNSVNSSVFGSGELVYNTPYAKQQFYKGREVEGEGRGRLWSYRYSRLRGAKLLRKVQKYVEAGNG